MATPDAIAHYEAVDLFVARATSARSDFKLTQDNAQAVARLCRELDGVPLAIELAAARIRVLSPQEIRDSLAERLTVLNLGYRDAEDRHQSLRACVEWSYDLCTHLEQKFWARSSVFTGGYDREAAAAVCGADDLPAEEVLDLVSGLVDQSVVLAEEASPGHTRYRMLTDIRHFGLERAEKDGERHGMQQRHATWFADLVSRFDDDACGPHQIDWLRRLRLEHPNLRTAMAYFAGAADDAAADLVMARSSTSTGRPPVSSTRHATGWRPGWPQAPGRRTSEPSRWPSRPGSRSCRTTGSGPRSLSRRATRWPPPSTTPGRSGC